MKRLRPLLSPARRAQLLQQAGIAADTGAPAAPELTASSPEIVAALHAWHEADRAPFERSYSRLQYERDEQKHAHDGGKRWLRLDVGTSGRYLVDKTSPTFDVYTIKGYGRPNWRIGTLAEVVENWRTQAERHAADPRYQPKGA